MDLSNEDCRGFKLTLQGCYQLMNSLRFNPNLAVDHICDEPFNQYILCLQRSMRGKEVIIEELKRYHTVIGSDKK